MFNVKIGPALCAYPSGCAHQGSVVLDLGAALTTNRNGYLVLPVQFQFQPGSLGHHGADRVPVRRAAADARPVSLPANQRRLCGTAWPTSRRAACQTRCSTAGVILAEFGIKYVLRGRWNFGGEVVSLPLFLNSSGAQLYYRFHLSAGVNF